uniref:Transmembrane protein 26 n=1 Tax=Scleropages formosus TaxID=113540 RepID=A0A8C9V1X3_SCLFO
MILLKFICAIITRFLFILVALIGVVRVIWVKKNVLYWLLTLLFLPLLVEMIVTLKRRKGKDYKWFSPTILLFLISIIPSIWILELHHLQNKSNDPHCKKLDSLENLKSMIGLDDLLSTVCSNDWILALHQILLILLIVGKWLLPIGGGVTKDELSQLLLIFVGTSADILEFTSETLSDVKWYSIVCLFIYNDAFIFYFFSVVNSRSEDSCEGQSGSLLKRHSTDIWGIVESLFIQDGPFLLVRLIVMTCHGIFHQMLVFFTIKNFLVVILSFYRLYVICLDSRSNTFGP